MGREQTPTSEEGLSRAPSRQGGEKDEKTQSRQGSALGSRAPSRAKSRGSISETRKTVSRPSSRAGSANRRPDSHVSNRSDKDNIDSDTEETRTRATSEQDAMSESGWDTDLEVEETRESYDASGRTTYKEACKMNGVVPVSYFLRHITDAELTMMHHGLGPAGAKAIAITLVANTTILKLNLSDNWLDSEGGIAIAEMLKENCYIAELDLSDNRLGDAGAAAMSEMLLQNVYLTHITLAGNAFGDKSSDGFAEVVLNNSKLEFVNLSRNAFSEPAGLILGPAISENITIRHLDLSWNYIRRKGAVALAKGIGSNIGLRKVDLSWNGLGNEGAMAMGEALKANSSLEELDLTNNRISPEGAVLLAKGLYVNETLKVLKVGKNPMQTAGCYAIIKAVKENANTAIEDLDFSDIQVNKDFEDLFKELKETRPELKVKHGGSEEEKKKKPKVNPMQKLQKYIQKNNLRLVDFFNKFDKDGSMSVSYDEFREGLEETGIDMSPDEIEMLIAELDRDGDGDINYSELVMTTTDFNKKMEEGSTVLIIAV
ncbi:leucine-rich repeat-containing protein 74B-like isoform X2 [Ptychodera flava]|uniref:leucine-rich repeat-containing protein 74B-like isoform X2 n=1 Tax=Ptychodera flava TaxID=63121 RepID=UPI00396A1FE4